MGANSIPAAFTLAEASKLLAEHADPAVRAAARTLAAELDEPAGPPPPPCGAMSPKLGATLPDMRRMGLLDRPDTSVSKHAWKLRKPPRPWRRVCVCALGHDGDWHRGDDGQVWHRSQALTAEQVAEQDAEQKRLAAELIERDLFLPVPDAPTRRVPDTPDDGQSATG